MSAHSVLLNLLNELRETDKRLCRISYSSFCATRFINSIIYGHECKILFIIKV